VDKLVDEIWNIYRQDPRRSELTIPEAKCFLRELLKDDPLRITEKSLGLLAATLAEGGPGVSKQAVARCLREGGN
jgi:hypothetical protein